MFIIAKQLKYIKLRLNTMSPILRILTHSIYICLDYEENQQTKAMKMLTLLNKNVLTTDPGYLVLVKDN